MTITAIFLQHPAGICIETEDNVTALLDDADTESSDWLVVQRQRDQAEVLIPIGNIASVVIGGHR